MKKYLLVTLIISISLLQSCTSDLDLTADWKDITVVYGLLDQGQDTQYVRVNRAFLGQQDAGEMAQVPDSLRYKNASVRVDEYNSDGTLTRTFSGVKLVNYPKDDGYFASEGHEVFAFATPAGSRLNTNRDYHLTVVNEETGKEVTAETKLCEPVSISKPSANQLKYALANAQLETYEAEKNLIEWTTAKNSKRYQVYVEFHWKNFVYSGTDTVPQKDSLKIYLGEEKGSKLTGGEALKMNFGTQKFFDEMEEYIKNEPDYNANVHHREAGVFNIIVDEAGDEMDTYMQVNEPSTGIIQERPEYTNLETEDNSAVGVFSSRYTEVRTVSEITLNSIKKLKNLELLFCDPFSSDVSIRCK